MPSANRDARTHTVTRLLEEAVSGKQEAVGALVSRVYDDLNELARKHLRGERRDHTLQVSDLVHEAWLRLAGDLKDHDWKSRADFYGVAATEAFAGNISNCP